MSRITPKDLAASLLKKFSPSKVASEENSLTPGDVDNLAAMMKSPNRMPPRNDADDIEDVEGAEYETYKAKETLSSEGLGGAQLSIGNALRQIENKSPMKKSPMSKSPFKGEAKNGKGKANAAKDKKKASAGDMQIEEKENDKGETAMEEEEVKGKDAKKKEVKKKGKSTDETKKDGGMEEEAEKPKDEEEKPAKTVKNFKKKKVQVEEDKEEKEKSQEKEKPQEKEKEKEKEKPKEKKGLNAKRKGKESDDEGEGEGEEKDEEVDAKKKQTKKLKKEDGEKVVAKKDEKNKSAEKKGKKEEGSAEKDKAEKEKAKKERKNKKKEDDDEEEKEKTEEKPEEDEGESAKKKKVGGIKSNEGSGAKKVVSFKEKDSGKKENKDEKEKEKEKEEPKKIGKFVKLTIDEEKLKDAVLKNKKGTATNAATKTKKDTKDVKEKKGKEDKKDKKKAEGKKEKKAKGEKKEKEGKGEKKKKTSGKKGKKKDEEEDEMEIEDDDEEDKESNMSQLYDDSEGDEDEEDEEENEFDDDDDAEFKKKVLKESGPEIDTYWKKNLRENATPEKKKVSGGKNSPFDISGSLKKTSKKVMNFSGLTQDDTEFLYASIKKLGGFDVQNLQDPSMTHLIYTGEKRTIKALYALAKRAWILEIGYVYSSFEFGDWIAEKDYECAGFPSKKARDEIGPLFKNMKFFFKSNNYLTLSLDELQNLVKLGGGKIVEEKEEADVIIENGKEKHDPMEEEISNSQGPVSVNHKWVLDSLTKYTKLDFADFPANE